MSKLRMPIDITMTLLSVVLMGGTILFPDDRVHQILGMVLLLLWICHTILNHRWYGSLFRGKYQPYRVMQIVVNLALSLCAALLMVSGMMMAWFVPSEFVGGALGFARTAHLVSSHWYYLFMCAHLGMHASMVLGKILKGRPMPIIPRIIIALTSLYGVYAFIVRGIAKYLFLRQQFFFLDLERGYLLFAADYLSILVLLATLSHFLGKAFLALGKKCMAGKNEL
ncbi:MAG: DUF4405 domain-containing protein [Treponema sp.]|nr:DUF4405 domain-containing protein [Treponema sp.]